MACNNTNGQTYLNSLVPAPGATEDSATYVLDLTHFTCGNRKICANGAFPTTADLKYQVVGIEPVGNGTYNCNILVSGTCTYMPHRNGQNACGCDTCPVTENIWTTLSVPVASAEVPAITAGLCHCSPTNLRDCCNVTNAISVTTSFNVATETVALTGTAAAKKASAAAIKA